MADPRGWLALCALCLLVLAVVVWGVTGSIPTEALGQGILLRSGGVSDVVATAGGQIEEMLVEVGSVVEKGQVVARVRQDALLREIEDIGAQLATAQEEFAALAKYAVEQQRLKAQGRQQKRTNLEQSIETMKRDMEILRQRIQEEETLLADGLITKQTLLGSQQELNGLADQLAGLELELDGLALDRLEARQQIAEARDASERSVQELGRSLEDLGAKLEENATIVSPHAGRVLEVLVQRGDLVAAGTATLSLEIMSEDLMAVLFVPASSGKQIVKGMPARISPSTIKREEHGFMIGEVVWVAEFPSTSRGMQRLLGNEELVSGLLEQGPPIRVDVALKPDPATPTGYQWSSKQGPSVQISSGTLSSGSVIVREQRPVNLVIPKVREKVGI